MGTVNAAARKPPKVAAHQEWSNSVLLTNQGTAHKKARRANRPWRPLMDYENDHFGDEENGVAPYDDESSGLMNDEEVGEEEEEGELSIDERPSFAPVHAPASSHARGLPVRKKGKSSAKKPKARARKAKRKMKRARRKTKRTRKAKRTTRKQHRAKAKRRKR